MYQLFEATRLLSLSSARPQHEQRPSVILSTFAELADWQILVLVCSNGQVVLYVRHLWEPRPHLWSLPWRQADVTALCIDPLVTRLALATADCTLHVLDITTFLSNDGCSASRKAIDDTRPIHLSPEQGTPTCICWWQTLKGVPVAVLGTELGVVCFVDQLGRRQLACTTIGPAVVDVQVVTSTVRSITHLLVTDVDQQHWHLLLEDKAAGYDWLRTGHAPAGGAPPTSEWRLWSSPEDPATLLEKKSQQTGPRRVSKLGRDTILDRQTVQGRQCLLLLDPSCGQLEVFDGGDVARRASCLYGVPVAGARHVLLTDHLLVVACTGGELHFFSRSALDLSSSSTAKKKECMDPRLQRFTLEEPALAVYPCSRTLHQPPSSQQEAAATGGGEPADDVPLASETFLDGCLVVTRWGVYACRPRCSAERLFLGFTGSPSTLPSAEHLGALLGLDIFGLYEAAAEAQLLRGHFSQAVRLYQLSKCPQLKRVAHFVSRGFLSELLAYVQVLFGTRASEIPVPDRVHFANVAALGFVQQLLAHRRRDRDALLQAFREFLRENLYFDASVVMRMLSEQRLYELLYHCAQLRGQRRLMIEQVVHFDPNLALDQATCAALASRGYGHLLMPAATEHFEACVTDPELLLPLSCDPALLGAHLRLLADLLPQLDRLDLMQRVARMYDASRAGPALALRRILLASGRQGRYPGGSSSSLSTDSLDLTQSEEETVTEEDLVKFLLFVLLMLNRHRSPKSCPYDPRLLHSGLYCPPAVGASSASRRTLSATTQQEPERHVACGQSHCALAVRGKAYTWGRAQFGRLGHRESHKEILGVTCVEMLDTLRVTQVACGTHHTLFNTDAGVFACGSSRFGQLGLGGLQRTWVPHLVDTLAGQEVVRVAAGLYHSLALTRDGRLFTWGWGVHGQLGHGSCADERLPREVAGLVDHRVTDAYGGAGHSAVLTAEGLVFTFGCNLFGQLGLGRSPKRSLPQQVDLGGPVRLLCSGFFQVLALLSSGRLLTWGANPQSLRLQAQSSRRSRLQAVVAQNELLSSLGPGSNLRNPNPLTQALLHGHQRHLSPTEVDLLTVRGPLVSMACGSNHALLLTRDGEVYAWGRNTEGQLGLGNRKDQKCPQLVSHLGAKVSQVACGRDFSMALDTQGKLWAWGQNDGGQLGCRVPPAVEDGRHTRVLSSRLITIRTSRCLITIPQGQRTGELRPLEVAPLPPEVLRPPPDDLEQSLRQRAFQNAYLSRSAPTFDLGSLDDPPYGPLALHTALEAFRGSYEPSSVINYCLRFSDFQAAAKVSLLEGQFAQAVEYQFKAHLCEPKPSCESLTASAMEAVTYYLGLIDKDNTEATCSFFENVVSFWQKQGLAVAPLEQLFWDHLPELGYSLGLVLFSAAAEERGRPTALPLSPSLCLSLAGCLRERVLSGRPHGELIDALLRQSGTAALAAQIRLVDESAGWEPAVPAQRLWGQLSCSLGRGLKRRACLKVSPSEVERLTQALLAEQAATAGCSPTDKVAVANVFLCGHHMTGAVLRESAVAEMEGCLLRRLQRPLPLTARLLARGYALPGVTPLACPRCVVSEIRANW